MASSTSLSRSTLHTPTAAEYEFINYYYEEYRRTLGLGGSDVWKLVNMIFPRFQSRFKRVQASDPIDFRPYAIWRFQEFQYIRDLLHAAANIRMRKDSTSKSANVAKTQPLPKSQPTGARTATTSEACVTDGDPGPSATVSVPHLDLAKRASFPERPLKGRATPFPTRVPPSKTLPSASTVTSVALARTLHRDEISPILSPELPPAPPPSAQPTPERELQPKVSNRPRRTATLLPTLKPRPPPSLLFSTPPRPLPSNQEIEDEMNQFDTEMQETDDELMEVTKWASETLSSGSRPRTSMSSASSVADPSPTVAASSSRRIRHLQKDEDPTPPRRSPRLLNIPPATLPLPERRSKRRVYALASYTLATDEEDNMELPPPETLVGQRAFAATEPNITDEAFFLERNAEDNDSRQVKRQRLRQ